ncbi:uncharacterized protein LOC106140460 [Amyelois transitella]|uniref:uncharacterized protein LOC106140460 n=1 Tax=Amyelois transitella TaxID=680683 RepID=UPI00067C70D8|nr:uncharacterized protein LOC106140460 [Amyelois transitella]
MESLTKSFSDSNLDFITQTEVTPNFVGARIKRKRNNSPTSTGYEDFKEEIIGMLNVLTEKIENNSVSLTHAFDDMRQSIKTIQDKVSYVSTQNEIMQQILDIMEIERKKDQEYIHFLDNQLEDTQRSSRKASIEIRNVSPKQNETKEDLISMITTLSETVGCPTVICKRDVRDIYRVKKNKDRENKTVVLELTSALVKTDLLKACKTYNYKNKTSKLSIKHLGFKTDGDSPIFLSEQLISKATRLYFLGRDLTRRNLFKYCWTTYGKVYLRKDDTSPIITITNESQIQTLSRLSA